MNHYEEGINAMWEEVEGRKLEPAHEPSEEERWKDLLFNSRNIRRHCFEYCYYSNAWCDFKGQIERFDKKKGKVIFKRIYILGGLMDGDCYEGKEDHVWMDIEPFGKYQVGDCLRFGGEIYRYLKTRNGKQISFGIREPYDITHIESYELPSDDNMIMQAADDVVCFFLKGDKNE